MAFARASGYNNLPNGYFTPVIYSKKAQIAFRKASVVLDITNTDYTGEVVNQGDTVNIIQEPTITVAALTRGQQVNVQDLTDNQIQLVVDKANYFAFRVDDIEEKQSHINWEELASNNAGYQLRDAFDTEVLLYMAGQAPSATTIGTTAASVEMRAGAGAGEYTPLAILNRFKRYLDVNNVPTENRWMVADPYFWEQMGDEASKFLNRDYVGPGATALANGRVYQDGLIRGFKCYESNNLPTGGTGPTDTTSGTTANYGTILAGHMSSTATVQQITKTDAQPDPNSFGTIVKGMHVYGRKALRTTALCAAYWHIGS